MPSVAIFLEIRHDLAGATVRKPEQVGVKSISAPLERDQSLLHEFLLAPTPVSLRNGAYTIAHVVPRNTRGLVPLCPPPP